MERRYKFWIETDDGARLVWPGLTERQAVEMYRRTRAAHPDGCRLFGWGPHNEPLAVTHREAFSY